MSPIAKAFALATALVALSLPSFAEDPASALQSAFETRYADLRVAMDARDSKALHAILAPRFASETVDGKTSTADQMIQDLSALPKDPSKVSTTTVVGVKKEGTKATVEQQYHVITNRALVAGGAVQKIEVQARSTDTWVEIEGVWLLERTVTRNLDVSIDGKFVTHKEHAPPG